MENARKHSNIKPMAKEMRRTYLVSKANYHYYKVFHRKVISKNEKM